MKEADKEGIQSRTLKKIKSIREDCHITQRDMAVRLGISALAYGKVERGVTTLTLKRMEQIAKALGTDAEYLILGERYLLLKRILSLWADKVRKGESSDSKQDFNSRLLHKIMFDNVP